MWIGLTFYSLCSLKSIKFSLLRPAESFNISLLRNSIWDVFSVSAIEKGEKMKNKRFFFFPNISLFWLILRLFCTTVAVLCKFLHCYSTVFWPVWCCLLSAGHPALRRGKATLPPPCPEPALWKPSWTRVKLRWLRLWARTPRSVRSSRTSKASWPR